MSLCFQLNLNFNPYVYMSVYLYRCFVLQIESVEAICLSNCSRLVAQNLHCCRNAGGQASATTQSGVLISIIQKGKQSVLFTS